MPISVQCKCGSSFKAKDHLAGKKVKCPKCQDVIQIPSAQPKMAAQSSPRPRNQISDLLDEEGIRPAVTGLTCPACNNPMSESDVICLECGYNVATGDYLETFVESEGDQAHTDAHATDADKIMAKAEREIADQPETATGQDFGDGADSYVVAVGAMAVMAFLILVGVLVVLGMEQFAGAAGMSLITFFGVLFVNMIARLYVVVIAFMQGIEHGLIALFIELYLFYFGYSRGMWMATTLVLITDLAIIPISFWITSSASDGAAG